MTATLQQAIKLLPLSRLELIQKVHQEILENPFLEEVATQETSDTELANAELPQETSQESEEFEVDWEAYLQDFNSSPDYVPTISKEVPSLEATLKSETSLAEHLLWQLSLTMHDELEKQIGTYLIGNITMMAICNVKRKRLQRGLGSRRSRSVLCSRLSNPSILLEWVHAIFKNRC